MMRLQKVSSAGVSKKNAPTKKAGTDHPTNMQASDCQTGLRPGAGTRLVRYGGLKTRKSHVDHIF